MAQNYSTYSAIETRMSSLANNSNYSSFCTLQTLPHKSSGPSSSLVPFGGIDIKYLEVGKGDLEVLIASGMHAGEWAPPDAVISFIEELCKAYHDEKAISYAPFTLTQVARAKDIDETNDDFEMQGSSIPYNDVKLIIDRLKIYFVPCVNPDGRDFSLSEGYAYSNVNYYYSDWRTNCREVGTCTGIPSPKKQTGVDLNRNFPIGWDMKRYYEWDATESPEKPCLESTTLDPCDDFVNFRNPNNPSFAEFVFSSSLYHGDESSASTGQVALPEHENEVKNIMHLLDNNPIKFVLDIHSFDGSIMIPFAFNVPQTDDPSMSYLNTTYDRDKTVLNQSDNSEGGRPSASEAYQDLINKGELLANRPFGSYKEYYPVSPEYNLLKDTRRLADAMKASIQDQAGAVDSRAWLRSDYHIQYLVDIYEHAGTLTDYALSKCMQWDAGQNKVTLTNRFPVLALTMEAGHDYENEFAPDTDPAVGEYHKVEREVHFGLQAFLAYAANWKEKF